MDHSLWGQYFPVETQKAGPAKSFTGFSHLRIGKGNPEFCNFSRSENRFEHFGIHTQESYIIHSVFYSCFCPFPHAGSLDIQSDKILFGIQFPQFDRIFSFAASDFQNDGMIVVKDLLIPFSLQGIIRTKYLLMLGLEHIG